jgi:hypothetical protein
MLAWIVMRRKVKLLTKDEAKGFSDSFAADAHFLWKK